MGNIYWIPVGKFRFLVCIEIMCSSTVVNSALTQIYGNVKPQTVYENQ